MNQITFYFSLVFSLSPTVILSGEVPEEARMRLERIVNSTAREISQNLSSDEQQRIYLYRHAAFLNGLLGKLDSYMVQSERRAEESIEDALRLTKAVVSPVYLENVHPKTTVYRDVPTDKLKTNIRTTNQDFVACGLESGHLRITTLLLWDWVAFHVYNPDEPPANLDSKTISARMVKYFIFPTSNSATPKNELKIRILEERDGYVLGYANFSAEDALKGKARPFTSIVAGPWLGANPWASGVPFIADAKQLYLGCTPWSSTGRPFESGLVEPPNRW